jgi:hypothetical protein
MVKSFGPGVTSEGKGIFIGQWVKSLPDKEQLWWQEHIKGAEDLRTWCKWLGLIDEIKLN